MACDSHREVLTLRSVWSVEECLLCVIHSHHCTERPFVEVGDCLALGWRSANIKAAEGMFPKPSAAQVRFMAAKLVKSALKRNLAGDADPQTWWDSSWLQFKLRLRCGALYRHTPSYGTSTSLCSRTVAHQQGQRCVWRNSLLRCWQQLVAVERPPPVPGPTRARFPRLPSLSVL